MTDSAWLAEIEAAHTIRVFKEVRDLGVDYAWDLCGQAVAIARCAMEREAKAVAAYQELDNWRVGHEEHHGEMAQLKERADKAEAEANFIEERRKQTLEAFRNAARQVDELTKERDAARAEAGRNHQRQEATTQLARLREQNDEQARLLGARMKVLERAWRERDTYYQMLLAELMRTGGLSSDEAGAKIEAALAGAEKAVGQMPTQAIGGEGEGLATTTTRTTAAVKPAEARDHDFPTRDGRCLSCGEPDSGGRGK